MKKITAILRGTYTGKNKTKFEKKDEAGKTTEVVESIRCQLTLDPDSEGNSIPVEYKLGKDDKTDYQLFQRYEVTIGVSTFKDQLYATSVSATQLKK